MAFDWDLFIASLSADRQWWEGRQIFHTGSCEKDYRDSEEAKLFVETVFKEAKPFDVDAELMKYAIDHVNIHGVYLEMGVCTGRTINLIAVLNPEKTIYGFDSFEGLPEDWDRPDLYIPKGTFHLDWLPPVLPNVTLVKGLFRDTLPVFKEKTLQNRPIAFLHIDCDIYSSTKDVFDLLGDHIVPGTVILFDEFYNYPNAKNHEFKAFQEFLASAKREAIYLAYNQYLEQAVALIK